LDSLVRKIAQALPPEILPPSLPHSFNDLLNLASTSFFGDNFDTGVRLWLGNGVAAGTYLFRGYAEYEVVAPITDRAAATNFLSNFLTQHGWKRSEQSDFYTLFTIPSYYNTTNAVLIRDDVVILSSNLAALDLSGVFQPNLGMNDYFNTALALLPNDSYN